MRGLIILITVFMAVGCVQEVPSQSERQIVIEEPEEKESEEMAEKEQMEQTEQTAPEIIIPDPAKLAPVPVYPAYLVTDYGAIFGIPPGLQGEGHKEHLTITDVDGNTLQGKIGFYTVRGMLYVVREWVDPAGVEHTDYYTQDLSIVDVPKIDLVDTAPKMPDDERVVFDSPEWLIKTVVLSGVEYSYLYNRHASVWGGAGDGEWVCRKNKITGFVVLEKGILIMSEDGAQFCPANRKGLNAVSEVGRLWK